MPIGSDLAGWTVNSERLNLEPARADSALESDLDVAEKKREQIERQVKSVIDAQQGACSGLVQRTLKEKLSEMDAEATLVDEHIQMIKSRLAGLSSSKRIVASFRAKVGSLRELAARGELTYQDEKTILRSPGVRVPAFKGGCRVEIEVEDAVIHHYSQHIPGTCY